MTDDQTIDAGALAAELFSIPSPSGDEGRVVDFVSRWLVARGWNMTIQEVTPGRGNVWASRSGGWRDPLDPSRTVPPLRPPRLVGDRLLGRGACDAKGIAAAMLVAPRRRLVASGEDRVDLFLLVGEERGSDGARAANQLPATSRFLINGEPTESHWPAAAKGSLRVTLRTRGREAHSAYPHSGNSAIEPMLAISSADSRRSSARRIRSSAQPRQHRRHPRRHRRQHRSGSWPKRRSCSGCLGDVGAVKHADRELGRRHSRDRIRIVYPRPAFQSCRGSRPRLWHTRPTSRSSTDGVRHCCSARARSTSPIRPMSTSTCASCGRASDTYERLVRTLLAS